MSNDNIIAIGILLFAIAGALVISSVVQRMHNYYKTNPDIQFPESSIAGYMNIVPRELLQFEVESLMLRLKVRFDDLMNACGYQNINEWDELSEYQLAKILVAYGNVCPSKIEVYLSSEEYKKLVEEYNSGRINDIWQLLRQRGGSETIV